MPRKGWKNISVREKLHAALEKDAALKGISISKNVETLTLKQILQVSDKQREILRCELYQMGSELKRENPGASAGEIRIFLHQMIDVSI